MEQALKDGWVQTCHVSLEEAAAKGTVIEYLLSDAGQGILALSPILRKAKRSFSHGFAITYRDLTVSFPKC
jgi:ketol-acid reductoisomerase